MKSKVRNDKVVDNALRVVGETHEPVSTLVVAKRLNLSWPTARAVLLTLAASGKIEAQRTSSGFVYSAKNESSH